LAIELEVRAKPKTKKQIDDFWQLWKRVKQVYPDKGKLEQEEILGKAYGISWRTVERWMEKLPRPKETLFEPAEEFLAIPFVKEWYDRLQRQTVRDRWKKRAVSVASEVWEKVGEKQDPRLWTKETIDRMIEYWVKKGYAESGIQTNKVALKKFLRESEIPELIKLETYVKVGAMATRRGIEEKFHTPLAPDQFLLLQGKMSEACKEYFEQHPVFPSAEWLGRLMDTALLTGVCTGARSGNWAEGRDMLGVAVLTDPKKLREVLTPKGKKVASYVLVMDGKIERWHFLAKWYLYWDKIYIPPVIQAKIESWIQFAGLKQGDPLFPITYDHYRKIFLKASEKTGLPFKVTHHNLRSTFLVWTCDSDIDLEIAIDFGVGWDTIETARKFYLQWRKKRYEDEAQKFFRYAQNIVGRALKTPTEV